MAKNFGHKFTVLRVRFYKVADVLYGLRLSEIRWLRYGLWFTVIKTVNRKENRNSGNIQAKLKLAILNPDRIYNSSYFDKFS